MDYLNWIDGVWQAGSSGEWDPNLNPAKPTQILGRSTRSTLADVQAAIEAAQKAQKGWAKTPRPMRGAILEKTAALLEKEIDVIAQTLTSEEGKNLSEAKGETQKAIHTLRFAAAESRRSTGSVIPSEMPNTFLYTTRAPLGVVGIITPWNFPICIPAWKIAPALLEGNSVIFKPATLTPGTAQLLVKAFEEAGLPRGVLNLLYGSGALVGGAITDDPRIHGISFTGSCEVGQDLYARAARRLARVQLEMGGKNPVIVLTDADLDRAAQAIVQGAFGSTGQRCTATSRVIVERSVHSALVEKMKTWVKKIQVGSGLENPQAMGPVVDRHQFQNVLQAIDQGKKQGSHLVCGGHRTGPDSPDAGYFIAPTLFDHVLPTTDLARKEIFGPVLAVIPVDDFESAIQVANDVEYGLSSSIFTHDIQRIMNYADQIETGILHVNSPTVGGEVQAPFGGMKATGLGGREMGTTGPEFFSEIKTVYIDYGSNPRKGNLY